MSRRSRAALRNARRRLTVSHRSESSRKRPYRASPSNLCLDGSSPNFGRCRMSPNPRIPYVYREPGGSLASIRGLGLHGPSSPAHHRRPTRHGHRPDRTFRSPAGALHRRHRRRHEGSCPGTRQVHLARGVDRPKNTVVRTAMVNRPGFRFYWEPGPARSGWADSRSA